MQRKVRFLILILLMSMPISGIISNLIESSTITLWVGRLFRLANIPLFILVIHNSNIKSILKQRFSILLVVIIYFSFFYYHTAYNPPLETRGINDIVFNVNSSTPLFYHLLFGLSLSIYINKDIAGFDSILVKFAPYSTIANAVLMVVMLLKHGAIFLFVEALSFNGVTLIIFSYQIVLTLLALIYLWKMKKVNKFSLILFAIINLALLLSMGKRGPLVSIFVVLLCLWLLRKFSIIKSSVILIIVISVYNIIISNIEYVISLIKIVNNRLGSTLYDLYYYGETSGRDTIHEYAYEQIEQYPLWGKFPGLINPSTLDWHFGIHPHNIWLEAIMTMGYIGSIPFFLYILYILIFKAMPAFSEKNAYLFFSMLFIAEFVHGFMSGSLSYSDIWLSLFVLSLYKKNDCIKSYGGR